MARTGFTVVAGAFLLLVGATACSDAGKLDESTASAPAATTASGGASKADNGRAFNSTDSAVETALKSALQATKVEFDGKEVRVHMPSGSASDPTAGLYCSSVAATIADDEMAFLVYSDGEYDCRDRS